jgi:hypothetical protein
VREVETIKERTNNLTPKPLGLSDRQLELVLDKSYCIDPTWRSRFLAGVVDQLLPKETVSDAEVEQACTSVAQRMFSRGRKGSDADDHQWEMRRA